MAHALSPRLVISITYRFCHKMSISRTLLSMFKDRGLIRTKSIGCDICFDFPWRLKRRIHSSFPFSPSNFDLYFHTDYCFPLYPFVQRSPFPSKISAYLFPSHTHAYIAYLFLYISRLINITDFLLWDLILTQS